MSWEQRAESDTSQSASGSQTIRMEVRATEEARHESHSSLWWGEIDREGGIEWEEVDWWEECVCMCVCGEDKNNESIGGWGSQEEVPSPSSDSEASEWGGRRTGEGEQELMWRFRRSQDNYSEISASVFWLIKSCFLDRYRTRELQRWVVETGGRRTELTSWACVLEASSAVIHHLIKESGLNLHLKINKSHQKTKTFLLRM